MIDPYAVDESRIWFRSESGWPDDVPKNMEFPRMTLGDLLDQTVARFPDQPAAWFLDTTMTYAQWKRHADGLATALHRLGLRKGDVVALLLPNSFQYVIAYQAVTRLGCVVSGVNPTYKPNEILHQLETIGASALIVLDALYEPQVAPIREQADLRLIVGTNITDFLPAPKRIIAQLLARLPLPDEIRGRPVPKPPIGRLPDDALAFRELVRTTPALPRVDIDPEEDAATYIMTGGTTGVPKAAVLTHFNCVSNALQARAWLARVPMGAGNVGVLPLFHSFAMTAVMNTTLAYGGQQILFPRPPPMEELVAKLAEVVPEAGAAFCGAEILFQKLAEVPGIEQSGIAEKLKLCISGAGPLHRPVQEKFESVTGAVLVEGYGLTEASPVVSAGPFWPEGERRVGTIGLPFPGTEWRIVDAAAPHKDLGIGENAEDSEHVGEIAVAGPQVMKGYLNKPDETADTIVVMDGKRWLLTGDIGYMDDTGQIVILDRKKQLIKYKGYSVFPKEVEELVGMHEQVREVAVAGLPDEEAGEIIKAWVVLEPGSGISEDELMAWCAESMTHYKRPRALEFRAELPKSLVGKVLRRELQIADPIWKRFHPDDPSA